jgi:hypothetical protein
LGYAKTAVILARRYDRERLLCAITSSQDYEPRKNVSGFAAAGMHPKTVQQLVRHSRIDLTMNLYTHVFRGDLAKARNTSPAYSTTPDR